MEDADPFGSITFSAPGSYTVDTSTYDYCDASIVDDCTILDPTEALLGSSTEGTLFVNTKVTYSSEICESCGNTGRGGWVSQPTSATTSTLYTVNNTNTYFVAGVEDYEVYVQHGGMVKWGYSKGAEFYGTSKTMSGALLGDSGESVEKTFKTTNAYDVMKVSDLLSAAGQSMCTASTCSSDDTRYTGGTILVELRYKNRVDHMSAEFIEDMDYYYHATYLPNLNDNVVSDIYPDLSNHPYGKARVKIERAGYTIVFKMTGGVGKVSFSVGWVHFVAGCFMFVIVDAVFQFILLCVCSEKLRHKIQVAKQAATEVFIYSSTAHKQQDGLYDHSFSAKSVLANEVELSDYQKKKHVQRKISRTQKDNEDFGRAP
eukprot:CAMPEP_0114333718 /NCGR_PEP_ID=MMETSP0101-20121206/3925_1 /TAXON_ID=38822 ORGANISM="Pteridomonas danica, Strain PT" /NCGR_SAMPLE_ID=MMETSP0101 /ASSEMBLY_ACC=CAM_ASM_000211 /LENGTH=372 /DNA_ID=CAMNT_0001464797 /DNA_START=178 /DNA_END=1293 /DNA_ORIENTATION=+